MFSSAPLSEQGNRARGYRRAPGASLGGGIVAALVLSTGAALASLFLSSGVAVGRAEKESVATFDIRAADRASPVAVPENIPDRTGREKPPAPSMRLRASVPAPRAIRSADTVSLVAPAPQSVEADIAPERRHEDSGAEAPRAPESTRDIASPPPRASSDAARIWSARIWRHIVARRPRGLRMAGVVILSFAVDRDGNIHDACVARSSGNAMLDRLALRGLGRAAPLPPPPDSVGDDALRFTIPFTFE